MDIKTVSFTTEREIERDREGDIKRIFNVDVFEFYEVYYDEKTPKQNLKHARFFIKVKTICLCQNGSQHKKKCIITNKG